MKHLKLFFVLFAMLALGVGNAWGAEVTMTAGTNGSACTVNGINGIKVGTSKAGGDMTITVPAGATSLQLYAAAWKGVTGLSINITPASNVNPTSISLTADDGITSNPPFTLKGNAESFKHEIALSNITSATTLTLASSTTKRFVVWGATCTIAGGEDPGTGGETPEPEPDPTPDPGTGGELVGEQTATYVVSTATAVTTSGIVPDGSSASLSGTGSLSSGFIQCTNGKNHTLTLKGYAGYKIKSISIHVKSNSSKGTGSFSVVAGSTTIASIAESAFNTANWNGSWNNSGVDKVLTMTNDSYEIQSGEDVKLTINCKSGSSNYNSLYIKSYTIVYESTSTGGETPEPETPATELTDAQFAWSAATAEATMGASNTFPTLTNTLPVSVTYESSTPATATIAADGTITLVAPGTTTISAKFAGGEVSGTTYAAKTVTYALTVLKAPATPTSTVYVKVTSTAGITDGEYLIVYEDAEGNPKAPVAFDGSLATLDVASNNIAVTISSNTIAGNTDIDAATFTIDATAKTIKSASGQYIGRTAYDNGLDSKIEVLTNTIEISEGNAVITASGNCVLRYNSASGQYRFRYYKSGQQPIALYKKASSHTLTYGTCTNGSVSADVADGATVLSGTTITLSNTPKTDYKLSAYDVYKTGDETTKVTVTNGKFIMPEFDVTISATFELAKTLTGIEITTPATQTIFWKGETFNHEGLKVTAHFEGAEDEDVTSKITVTGSTATAGNQTVTVSYKEGEVTKDATYTITVKAIPNTKETAYTVADAYDIIDKLTTAEGVFISGIISQVDSYNETHKSITYWISADGTTTNQLQVYGGKGLDNADFASQLDLTVGDQVIVVGKLKKFNSTYEFDANNYLASHTPTTKDPAGLAYATTSYTANVGEAFTTPDLTNPHNLVVTYSTSDASKATVDVNTGAVTIVAAGEVTITASTTGDATHDAGSASYNITITDPSLAIATLPFYFDGKRADIESTAGMTHEGIDSDYSAAPYLKFNTAGDWAIVQFDSEPGEFSFLLKQYGSNAGTFTVYESANGEDYTSIWSGGDLGGDKESATIEPTLSPTARYVKFEYTTKEPNTNYGLGSISIAKPDFRQEAGLAWSVESVILNQGDEFTAPTLYNDNGLTLTCSSTDESVATVTSEGVITLAGAIGTTTITASFAGNEYYKPAEVSCKITVNKAQLPTGTFALYSGDIVEGDYVITYENYAMKAADDDDSERLDFDEIAPVDNKINNPSSMIVWHILPSGEYWAIYNEYVEKYAASITATKNKATLVDEVNDNAKWSITGPAIFDFINYERENSSKDKDNKFLRKNGDFGFGCYAFGTGGALTLYRKQTQHTVTVATCTNGSVSASVEHGATVLSGEIITLSNTPDAGYLLTEYNVYKTGDETVKVTVTDGTFMMPAFDVTISAIFELIPTITLGDGDNSAVIAANDGSVVNVQLNRSFTANDGYYTLCLPFDIAASEIGTAYKLDAITKHVSGEEGGININLTPVSEIEAGVPYFVLPKTLTNPVFENVTINNIDPATKATITSGDGVKVTFTGIINGVGEQTNGSTEYYVGDNGYLYNGTVDKLGLRAFFTITDEAGNPTQIRARVVAGENGVTGVEDIITNDAPQKVIENGQLVIIRDGVKYNVQGQKL